MLILPLDTIDGSEIGLENQLSLVVEILLFTRFLISVGCLGFQPSTVCSFFWVAFYITFYSL